MLSERDIEIKTFVVNMANQTIFDYAGQIQDILQYYIGKKIINNDNSIRKDVKDKIDKIEFNGNKVYDLASNDSITIKARVKSTVSDIEYTSYTKIAELEDGILFNLPKVHANRFDYTSKEVRSQLKKVKRLNDQINKIQEKYPEFVS